MNEETQEVLCSICHEVVNGYRDRGYAHLQCGHKFHIDCVGSAFNAKGKMECPTCREIGMGEWLFPNGLQSSTESSDVDSVDTEDASPSPEFSDDDSANIEDAYDSTQTESSSSSELSDDDSVNTEDADDLTHFEPSLFPFAGISDLSLIDTAAFEIGQEKEYESYWAPKKGIHNSPTERTVHMGFWHMFMPSLKISDCRQRRMGRQGNHYHHHCLRDGSNTTGRLPSCAVTNSEDLRFHGDHELHAWFWEVMLKKQLTGHADARLICGWFWKQSLSQPDSLKVLPVITSPNHYLS